MTLMHLSPDACAACGAEAIEWVTHEPALFLHGGYGATRRTIVAACGECGWSLIREVGEVAP